jgi:hypothetical protein
MKPQSAFRNLGVLVLAGAAWVPGQAAGAPGTNPVPLISSTLVPRFTIQSAVGITNQIQYCTNLSRTNWLVLTNLVVTQSPYWFVDVAAPATPARYYRVVNPVTVTTNILVTLQQLWGGAGVTNQATNLIQRSSTPMPVNTAWAAFDASHTALWLPLSFVPAWATGTTVYWGNGLGRMQVLGAGSQSMLFQSLGEYFGWPAGTVITASLTYTLTTVVTANSKWVSPGTGGTVQVTASAVSGAVGDVVWVGGVGKSQFKILDIAK